MTTQREVLDPKIEPRRYETSEPIEEGGDSGAHRDRMEGRGSGVDDAAGRDWW